MGKAEKLFHKYGYDHYKTQFRIAKKQNLNSLQQLNVLIMKKSEDCTNESSKLYTLSNRLLGKSYGYNSVPIRSNDLQLANEFSEHMLLKDKGIKDMFKTTPPTKNQSIPDFPALPLTNFSEKNQEKILCLARTVNETNCANDTFIIRKMSSEIFSDPITTIFTDTVNNQISSGVFPDSEKFTVVKPFLKTDNNRDESSSYRPLYNT